MLALPALTLLQWLYMAVVVLVAGVIRGATGFGFSMICIVLLTFFMAPAAITPVIVLWEISASVGHLPFVYKDVDWKTLRPLLGGVVAGTPLGAYCLATWDAAPMTVVINAVVLCMTILLFCGFSIRQRPGRLGSLAVGTVSGVVNGATANGGPPVILFFLSGPASAAVGRASLIAFFLCTDVLAATAYGYYGLLNGQVFSVAGIMLVPMFVGIWLGSHWFRHVDERFFRRVVQLLLLAICLAGLVPALWKML